MGLPVKGGSPCQEPEDRLTHHDARNCLRPYVAVRDDTGRHAMFPDRLLPGSADSGFGVPVLAHHSLKNRRKEMQ
jgi:hypothetical protein